MARFVQIWTGVNEAVQYRQAEALQLHYILLINCSTAEETGKFQDVDLREQELLLMTVTVSKKDVEVEVSVGRGTKEVMIKVMGPESFSRVVYESCKLHVDCAARYRYYNREKLAAFENDIHRNTR